MVNEYRKYTQTLSKWQKVILWLGWINIISPLLWIWILINFSEDKNKEKRFWDERTYKVIYMYGWFFLITIIYFLIIFTLPIIFKN